MQSYLNGCVMQDLGERIKKRREFLGISTGDLAASVDVSSSLISQIERTKAYPSILTLQKIAAALDTTVGALIGEYENMVTNPFLKSEDKRFVKENEQGTKLYLLSHHDPKKHMDPFLIELQPGGDASDIMTLKNPRQEFCYALNGKFEVKLNDTVYELEEGDCFYFYSNMEHQFKNISKKTARLIWVVNQLINS